MKTGFKTVGICIVLFLTYFRLLKCCVQLEKYLKENLVRINVSKKILRLLNNIEWRINFKIITSMRKLC